MSLSPQFLDELRSRTLLSALIGRTTKLQKAGREFRACCPFHNEKSPSFYVNDDKAFYHCFGCGAHGDAIRWMTDQRGLPFMDAVKELAQAAGMELPAMDPRAAEKAEQAKGLHDAMKAAADWFEAQLGGVDGGEAVALLKRRGISDQARRDFGLGFAPDSRGKLRTALRDFGDPMLVETGLLIKVDDKEPYDRFRGRLMIPIRDPRGRTIAFGGRIIGDGEPKYLNSPETPLFDKGRTLYNQHRASPASRTTGRVIVVEGYMDVVALAAGGFAEVVAPMGTALTESQIELLWRMCEKPVLCFDGDTAGRRAAMRAAERALPLLRPGHSLQIVTLPAGLDPDDLIRRDGAKAFEKLLGESVSLVDLLWQHEQQASPLTTPEDKAGLKARLLGHVEAIADPDIAALYRRELLDRYGALVFPQREFKPREFQKTEFRKGFPPRPVPQRASPADVAQLRRGAGGAARDTLVQAVILGISRFPEQILRHADSLLRLAANDAELARSVDYLLEYSAALEAGENPPISAAGVLPPPPDNTRFSFLVEGTDPEGAREDLAEAVALLVEKPALEAAINAATARFATDPEGAFAEQQRLRKRKLEIDSRLGQMARKRAAPVALENSELPDAKAAGQQEMD